jgi:SanA protein
MLRYLSFFLWTLVALPALGLLFIIINYFLITWSAEDSILPAGLTETNGEWILLPGAGSSDPEQWINHTFDHRLEAATRIWDEDSTVRFIASGMILPPYYNEPEDIKNRLLENGIPESSVIRDTNGTRTWNSVRNTIKITGGKPVIIVSQQEHLERALFCASCMGVEAAGIAAEDPPYSHRFWTYREYLARVKATMDCVAFRLKNK